MQEIVLAKIEFIGVVIFTVIPRLIDSRAAAIRDLL